MHRELTLMFCLMCLMATAAMPIAFAQTGINETSNNTTQNETALNGTALNESAINETALVNAGLEQTALNLSIINNVTVDTAPISDMAKAAPEVAAKAAAVQVATDPETVFKLGEGIGGRNLFEVKDREISTMEIGIPIKPMRDVGKMVFVCDIV